MEDWKDGSPPIQNFEGLLHLEGCGPGLSGNIVFRILIKALIAATDLEDCGPETVWQHRFPDLDQSSHCCYRPGGLRSLAAVEAALGLVLPGISGFD